LVFEISVPDGESITGVVPLPPALLSYALSFLFREPRVAGVVSRFDCDRAAPRSVMTVVMAKLSYACVLTRNIDLLARFYRDILQAEPQWTGLYAEFPTGACALSLWSADAYAQLAGAAAPNSGDAPIMLEFEIDDVDAEFARLQQLVEFTIEFIIPPTTMAWGNRSIYFRDPDGNLVNLFSRAGSS
jgi:catechol 2,3-dioxygenase-like lactoylglutathione lyase family enzyme